MPRLHGGNHRNKAEKWIATGSISSDVANQAPSLFQYWKDHLEADLAGFADPGTPVVVGADGNILTATWEQRGQQRIERFSLSQAGDFRWLDINGQRENYPTFLSSPRMADFDQLAKAISRVFAPLPHFVATNAKIGLADGEEQLIEASPAGLREAVVAARRTHGRTSLFFVKGDAGAGKTTLLKELTAEQAKKYVRADSQFLFLYVSAQGRALSNLRDAFSGELQDLRAGFTRDAVPALVREGLLVPVIDGFDELLGAAGYGDAFNSLRQFLLELQGHGTVLVSARSAFYNLEFISRAPDVADSDWSLQPVSLLPWNDGQLYSYLNQHETAAGKHQYRSAVDRLSASDRTLLTKPFFASKFPDYAAAADDADRPRSLLDFLINEYIARETGKTLGASGSPLLSRDGHRKLLEEAAEHMWQAEKRRLSLEELQVLVELVAEDEGLGGDEARQVVAKVTSTIGFRTHSGPGSGRFEFDHEVYFDYFLSQALVRHLEQPENLGLFFDRGVLPSDAITAGLMAHSAPGFIANVVSPVSAALRHENRRRNAGACVAAYAQQHGPVVDETIRNASFLEVDFGHSVFRNVKFEGCEFTGSRLDRARFEDCDATSSRFQSVVVTNESHLDFAGIIPGANFGSLIHPDVDDEIFSPQEVAEVLRRLSAPLPGATVETFKYSPRAKVLIKLLQIMARAYRRANILFESDEHLAKLFTAKQWPALRKVLTENKVVREEERAVSGPTVRAYRLLVALDALLSGENASAPPSGPIADFWSAMRAIPPNARS